MKTIKKLFVLLMVLALLATGLATSPKAAQAQTPPEKLAVFEAFGWIHWWHCAISGPVINQLAIDNADKNIVYIDYSYRNPVLSRWEVIKHTEEGMGLTWAMVDSGQKYSRGASTDEEAIEKYTAMSNYAMEQEALADVKAEYYIKDNMAYFKVTVTNLSEVTLSPENNAGVHAIIKEAGYQHSRHTSLHAARGVGMEAIESLEPNETATYHIAFPLKYIHDMDNIVAVALVDYQTAPDGIFDQLNAAIGTAVDPVDATLTVSPASTTLLMPFGREEVDPIQLTVNAGEGVEWTVTANQPWVTIDPVEGVEGETPVTVSIDPEALLGGENQVQLYFWDADSGTYATAHISVIVEYQGESWDYLFFPRMYIPLLETKE